MVFTTHLGILSLIVFGLAILWVCKISFDRREGSESSPMRQFFSAIGIFMILTGMVESLFFSTGFLLPFFLIATLLIILFAVHRYRAQLKRSVTRVLIAGIERQIPLDQLADAISFERHDSFGSNAKNLAEQLRKGTSVPDALQQSRTLVSSNVLFAAKFGWNTGTLAPSLRDAISAERPFDKLKQVAFGRLAYCMVGLIGVAIIYPFVFVYVLPELFSIEQEFETDINFISAIFNSPATNQIGNFLWSGLEFWYLLFLPLPIWMPFYFLGNRNKRRYRKLSLTEKLGWFFSWGAVISGTILIVSLLLISLPSIPPEVARNVFMVTASVFSLFWMPMSIVTLFLILMVPFAFVLSFVGWLPKNFGIVELIWFRKDLGQIYQCLSIGVEKEQPIHNLIKVMSENYPKKRIKKSLALTLYRIEKGQDWAEAFHSVGMLSKQESAFLQAAQRSENLSWALSELATGMRRRMLLRYNSLINFAVPSLIMLTGGLTLFLAWVVFGHLANLVNSLV